MARQATKNLGPCTVVGCIRPATARELCAGHYHQQYEGKEFHRLQPTTRTNPSLRAEIVRSIWKGEPIVSIGQRLDMHFSTVARVFKRVTGTSVREYKRAGESR